jgi:transcriptional regulator with XRE-family HTH domain
MKRARKKQAEWEAWMRGMGRYTRRLRELAGLSQEQLARRASVSQGAISRLEAGRAVNTPLIVVMRINAAMRGALAGLGEGILSEEARRVMEVPARGIPSSEPSFECAPIAAHPLLAELVQIFWRVPIRERDNLLRIVRVVAGVLTPEEDGPAPADTADHDPAE